LASLFVKCAIRNEAFPGANSPNFAYPLPLIFGAEVLASSLLMMAVILLVVYTKGLSGFGGIVIGAMVGLDIFFLTFIAGESMNPVAHWPLLYCQGEWRKVFDFIGPPLLLERP
jgi:aquaporin Z